MTIEELLKKTRNVLAMSSPYAFDMLIRTFLVENKDIETLRVFTRDGRLYLEYNHEFVKKYKNPARSFMLCHECLHLLLHHCTDYRAPTDAKDRFLNNMAMDLAVNSLIPIDHILLEYPTVFDENGLPTKVPNCLLPSQFRFDDYLSYEQYKELLDGITVNVPLGDLIQKYGDKMHDDHSKFTDDPSSESFVNDMFKYHDRNRMWGNMSVPAVRAISIAQTRQIPWHRYVRSELGRMVTYDRVPTRRRYHKYFHKPFFGYTYRTVRPIACYLDVSGSMGTRTLETMLGELQKAAAICPVFLWTFDCEVEFPDRFRLLTRHDFMNNVKVDGGGGTAFTPIFEHALKKGLNNIIIMTDGCAEKVETPLPRNFRALWVVQDTGDTKQWFNEVGQPGRAVFVKDWKD